MIGMLKGTVELFDGPQVIVDVNGVGYRVLLSTHTASQLSLHDTVTLFIYPHIREDLFELFGFLSQEELKLFELLISVSGVGPKTAQGIFSIGKAEDIKNAIMTADVAFFASVPRLGKKNAQKIIIELKNKVGSDVDLDLSKKESEDNAEVVTALKSMGFTTAEVQNALKALKGQETTIEGKIKLVLQYLGK